MPYTNSVTVTYLHGPTPVPTVTATLWRLVGVLGKPPGTFYRYLEEQATVSGGMFTFATEPASTPRSVALDLHEATWPGMLLRSTLFDPALPTPAPADPNGFVD